MSGLLWVALAAAQALPDDCGATHRWRFATVDDPFHCVRDRSPAIRAWLAAESEAAHRAVEGPGLRPLEAELEASLTRGAPEVRRASDLWYGLDPDTRHLLRWSDPAQPALAADLSSLPAGGHLGQVSATPSGVLFTWDADGDEVYALYAATLGGRPALLTDGVASAFAPIAGGTLIVRHDATFRPDRVLLRAPDGHERMIRRERDARFYLDLEPGPTPRLWAESASTSEARDWTGAGFGSPLVSRRRGVQYAASATHVAVEGESRLDPFVEGASPIELPGQVEALGRSSNLAILRTPTGALGAWQVQAAPVAVAGLPDHGVPSFVADDGTGSGAALTWSAPFAPPQLFLVDANGAHPSPWPAALSPRAPAGAYGSLRAAAGASDGVQVPYTVLWRCPAAACDAPPPDRAAVLFAYGAYGSPWDPAWDPTLPALLDRDVTVVLGHVRGGGDLGPDWHEAGRLANKVNTFTDVIAVAEDLRSRGWATRLGLHGMSAGGAMVGAVLNRAPGLFDAAVADVPFVDALETMLDPTLPLTITEYEEWGDPRTRAGFEQIRAWAPIVQVTPQAYPPVLAIGAWNDSSVPYWEPAKWILRLRAADTDGGDLVLEVRPTGGHMGSAAAAEHAREVALQWAFLLKHLRVNQN